MSKSNALNSLNVLVAKWRNPTAWERVAQDEPLTPVKGQWINDGAATITTSSPISIQPGTMLTTGTGQMLVMYDYAALEIRSVLARMQGSGVHQLDIFPSTSVPGQNEPHPSADMVETHGAPPPRNREERRTLQSVRGRLPELVRRAVQKFGPRQYPTEAWDEKFWKMVTPQRRRPNEPR